MYKQTATQPTVLYLRVDLGGQHLTAGGSVAHTLGVLKGFSSNNWSILCASSAMVSPLSSLETISFAPLQMPRLLRPLRWKINSLLSNMLFTARIIRLCAGTPITCVYQRHAPFSVVGVLVAWWLRVPLMLEYNGSEVWMARHWDVKSLFSLQWLLKMFEQKALHGATHIVVVSQASYDELMRAGVAPAKIILQPNGVDPHELDPAQLLNERNRIRDLYKYQDRFVFGFVGTFSPWHGIDQLAQMIPAILAREPQAAFLLIGDGQLKQWLEDALTAHAVDNRRVIFTGKVAQQHAKEYLAACDAFLLPTQPNADGTQFFGSPIKLFEYMSMAKPIIASNIAQVADMLSGIGFLVDPHDTKGFIDAACRVIHQDAEQRRAMGVRTREYVIAHCTWHEHVRAIANRVKIDTKKGESVI